MNTTKSSLMLSRAANRNQRLARWFGEGLLLVITSLSMLAVVFILFFIARDAFPFFNSWTHCKAFFTSTHWYPTRDPSEFGALSILFGSALVTLGAALVAIPLGLAAAVCLSDVLPFHIRQYVKPVIEMLAAIPSVAYGFFALVVFAPALQERGGPMLAWAFWIVVTPILFLTVLVLSDLISARLPEKVRPMARTLVLVTLGALAGWFLWKTGVILRGLEISSGTNALNAAIILGIMALPTMVSVSEDALQATGRDLRMASYALGATRAETLVRVVIPAAASGILAAAILSIMRAIGETMVVWMASGNAARIPEPWFNFLDPVRTLTATIAGDMGEADQSAGSAHYHVLFAMALVLLLFSLVCNLVSESMISRTRRRLR
ncbi:MAG: phosphate ABC transporter permease subunit PstC [Verrucomicrobia bacterium]|nr:MAG: phosphate ABC transporter permease subunit PstC [Verrucomicrobiota bacterium]